MNPKKARRISSLMYVAAIPVLFSLYAFKEVNAGFYAVTAAALLLLLGGFAITLAFYKCPHCGSPLSGRSWGYPEYCPHCGKKLDL